MAGCIDQIYEGDKVYPAKDYSSEELDKFIESLDSKSLKKLKTFETMPSLREEIDVTNPKTK